MTGLVDLVVAAGGDRLPPRAELGAALDAFEARATRAVPDVKTDASALARTLAPRLVSSDRPLELLATLDAEEIWLACACSVGDPVALRHVERRYIAPLAVALRPMKLGDARRDDVLQAVRRKLLVPDADGAAKLADYAGRGRLAALVRVVAVRTALDEIRVEARRVDRVAGEAPEVDALMEGALSPDLELIRARHRDAFKAAFQAAIADLSSKDRGVLRLHLRDRLNIDDIAALHDVHRSSAARWLKDIRAALGKATRARLRAQLSMSRDEMDSMFRALDSQLDLSFSRILADAPSPG
ncbi:MAG: RNA polymerase subunit sigma-70 [Myxococcota bacterium]